MAIPIEHKIRIENYKEDREFWKDCVIAQLNRGGMTTNVAAMNATRAVSQLQEFRKSQ